MTAGIVGVLGLMPICGVVAAIAFAVWLLASRRPDMAGTVLALTGGELLIIAGFINYQAGDDILGFMVLGYSVMLGVALAFGAGVVFLLAAWKHRRKRFRSVCCALAVTLLPVLWFAVGGPVTSSLRVARVSHPKSRSEYPNELLKILEAAEEKQIPVEQLKVFCVSRGWYQEYYWQTKASPELLDLCTTRWKLSPVDKDSREVQYFWQRMPDSWRIPQTNETEFFVSSHWVFTEYGVVVMHDKAHQHLFFWYMFDF